MRIRSFGNAIVIFTTVVASFILSTRAASSENEVYFAGLAYTGNASDVNLVLPSTSAILNSEGMSRVQNAIRSTLNLNPPKNFRLIYDDLAYTARGTSAVVLAATLDRETILIEKIGNDYKILVELAGQALFFDFRENQILFSYPITVQHIDYKNYEPTPLDINNILAAILFEQDASSFSDNFVKKLADISLPDYAARRFRVVSVEVSDSIRSRHKNLIDNLFDTGVIGHELSKILSDNLAIPILPYKSGQAIGGAMSIRFANADIFNLRIPDADYEISLDVSDFRGRTLEETRAFRQELIGAFFDIKVVEPLSGRVFFGQSLRQGATKVIPSTQDGYDEDAAYYETLILGLNEFSKSITGGNREWVNQQSDSRQLSRQLEPLRNLIDRSR